MMKPVYMGVLLAVLLCGCNGSLSSNTSGATVPAPTAVRIIPA